MRWLLTLLPLLVLAMAVAACGDDTPDATPGPAPSATATIDPDLVVLVVRGEDGAEATVYVELALTSAERQQGLMGREELPENQGMLFLYNADHSGGYWMKDTPVPLDIAYLAADGTVQEVRKGEPFNETLLVPEAPYRNTLEVNQGWFERHGLGVGDVVEIPDGLPAPE